MTRKRTHEEFIKELQEINPNIEVLGTYKTALTKIKCKCTIDGHEWAARPNDLLHGSGCPKCAGNIKKTPEEFLDKFYEKNTHAHDIEILGHYVNALTKIKCRCKIDGYEWEATPNSLLSGCGCHKCSITKQTKTHEQFIPELKQINPDIEVLGTYVNMKTKILCKCKVCDHIWEAKPNSLLQGTGCPKCAGNIKLTHEQFIQELQEINQDIEILGTYINCSTKILCRCKIDGYEWETAPIDLLRGHGCPKCAGVIKRTHEQFLQELQQINTDIEVLGTYVTNITKIKVRCKIDGYEWETRPIDLLKGHGCRKCALRKQAEQQTKTHEQFIAELQEINPDILVLETYKGSEIKIKCRCKRDGYEWEARPASLLQGIGCRVCGYRIVSDKLGKTHEQFIKDLQQINPDIEVLGTYINSQTKILCKCKIDGYEWEVTPNRLLQGSGCPKCNITKGEKRVAQYLDNLGIEYIYNMGYFNDLVGTGGGLLRPDFIIPSLKIWIEYDGIQHFEPIDFTGKMSEEQVQQLFEYTQQNDQIKNQYAKDNNWTLIRIPYWEIDNIEQILDAVIKQKEAI